MMPESGQVRFEEWFWVLCAVSGIVLSGCGSGGDVGGYQNAVCSENAGRLALSLQDSVVLLESDSVFVGKPGVTFLIGDEGRFYIPDQSSNRLLVFSGSGMPVGPVGRFGGGLGEFRSIGTFGAIVGDLVLHDDDGGRRINVFDRETLTPLVTVPYQGYLSWVAVSGERQVDLSLVDQGLWRVGGVGSSLDLSGISATSPVASREVLRANITTAPDAYTRYPMLFQWVSAKMISSGRERIIAYGGVDYLVHEAEGQPASTVSIPACDRRGNPTEVLERKFRAKPSVQAELARLAEDNSTLISALVGLWRLSDGRLLIWYQDPMRDGAVFKGVAYLSVIEPGLGRACVDAKVVAPGTGLARLTMHDDMIYLLDQMISEEGERPTVTTVIRKYAIDDSQCTWLPTLRYSADGP